MPASSALTTSTKNALPFINAVKVRSIHFVRCEVLFGNVSGDPSGDEISVTPLSNKPNLNLLFKMSGVKGLSPGFRTATSRDRRRAPGMRTNRRSDVMLPVHWMIFNMCVKTLHNATLVLLILRAKRVFKHATSPTTS